MFYSPLNIVSINKSLDDLFEQYKDEFVTEIGNFDPSQVVGSLMDTFHTPELAKRSLFEI